MCILSILNKLGLLGLTRRLVGDIRMFFRRRKLIILGSLLYN